MNRLTVIGRLVRETELKEVGDGRVVMNNTIAIARPFKSENSPDTDFLNFVAWGKRGELIEEYCDKGDLIGLDGRIQSRTYQNDKQDKVYITEMNVESVHFIQSKREKSKRTTTESNATPNEAIRSTTEQPTNSAPRTDQATVSANEVNIDHIQTANS